MQTKPFSVQSPEDIAKQYGGNKQKIAQACQAGIVDPTAGLLSCMFIDRMRSAQAQEMSPQPTVAQQVMAPPSQPAAPLGSPAAGLGAAAPASGAAKFFGAPPAPPAPMGMASGGLASLPVPDDMFDAGDEYAAGGIVAFADGGETPALSEEERLRQYMQMMQGLTGAPPQATYMQDALASQDADKRRDTGLALLQMAAGVAGSKSRNALAALGEGVAAGIPTLQKSEEGRRAARLEAEKLKYQNDLAKYNADVAAASAASGAMTAKDKAAFEKEKFKTETELAEERNRIAKMATTADRSTGEERMMAQFMQASPEQRAAMEEYFKARSAGLMGLPLNATDKMQRAMQAVNEEHADRLSLLEIRAQLKGDVGKKAQAELDALKKQIAAEKLQIQKQFEAAGAGVGLTPTTGAGAGAGAGTTGIELIAIRPGT